MNDYYYYYTQVALYSTSMAFDAILLILPIWPLWKRSFFPVFFFSLVVIADNVPCSADATSSTRLSRCGLHAWGRVSSLQCSLAAKFALTHSKCQRGRRLETGNLCYRIRPIHSYRPSLYVKSFIHFCSICLFYLPTPANRQG